MSVTLSLAASRVAAAAEVLPADVEARAEDGFGRIVLTFRDRSLLPSFDARISSGVLRIAFENEVDVKVSDIPLALSDYISVARRDPDGTGIRLALKHDLRINTMEAGEKLFIDLLPPNWTGLPPGLPDDVVQELARRAEAALRRVRELEQAQLENRTGPKVELRIGEHPTFTRLVFDWTLRFDSKFIREDDLVKVIFNHSAELDLSELRARLPVGVVDATAFDADESLNFLMRVDPAVDIRAFREDQTYVIDIVQPLDAGDGVSDAAQPAAGPGMVTQRVSAPSSREQGSSASPESAPAMAPEPLAPQAPVMPDDRSGAMPEPATTAMTPVVPRPESAPVPNALPAEPMLQPEPARAAEMRAEQPPAESVDESQTGSVVEPMSIGDLIAANTYTGIQPVPEPASDYAQSTDAPVTGSQAVPVTEAPNPEAFTEDQVAEIRNFVSVEARRIGDTVRVVFPFADPVAAAVFRRGNSVWLVFDTDVPIDLRAIETAMGASMRSIDVSEHSGWQTVTMRLTDRALTTIGTDGAGWILTIGDMILEPSRPLQLERNVRGDGSSVLRVGFGAPKMTHVIDDPAVGDQIIAVTGLGPARGLIKAQSFVELQTLTSAHGVAILPHVDDLKLSYAGDDIIIERADGLALSNGNLSSGSSIHQNGQQEEEEQGFIDFSRLAMPNPADYLKMLQRLEGNVAALPARERKTARLELARFQLANRYAHEAIGILSLVNEESGVAANDPTYHMLMGAALVLASRPTEALANLKSSELLDNPDAAVWRVMAEAALGEWTAARLAIPRAQAVIGNYPPELLTEFNLVSARSLVEVNDFGTAAAFLSEVDSDFMTRAQATRYDILRGRIADAAGRFEEALRAFDIASRSKDRPGAAEAKLRALRMRYRDGDLDVGEATEQLESLTTVWRGDEVELQALRFLAQLYAETGQYRSAFTSLRAAIQAQSGSPTTRLMQEEMNGVFTTLFLDGKADDLPPIDALALYYDFRELTPVGRNGDEMVRRLADRLISVDLLGQAAELLQHQVDNRLKGAARAQIAADLALVYLLDRKPEKALAVMNRTRQAHLPKSLDRQRRIVEARALTDTGRSDLALELIGNLRGAEIDRQRADTLWQGERWQEAGEQLEGMHGVRWSDPLRLDEQERLDILRAAIAYSLGGDQLGLDRLRSKYVAKMSDSPSGAAFDIVTRPIDSKGVEFMAIAKEIAAVDTLESFLAEYRRHYLNGGAPAPDMEPLPQAGAAADAPDPAATAG
ncbi:hypothetical protein D1F64_15715 [Breoghania sp. L-A4]|nr:hypothetical protein D1F64_15715 [Breoghania sp. L-A4]